MRLLTLAVICFFSTGFALSREITALEEQAAFLKPERVRLVACWSDLVDRAKAHDMTDAEFKKMIPKSCSNERQDFQKAILNTMALTLEIDESKRQEIAESTVVVLLVPIFNEFSGQAPYRYRLKDAEKAKTPTPEDIAFKSAREKYVECLSMFATSFKANGMSAEVFKKSLTNACPDESEVVRQSERRLWETYVNPPKDLSAAGSLVIRYAKLKVIQQYTNLTGSPR